MLEQGFEQQEQRLKLMIGEAKRQEARLKTVVAE